MIYTGPLKPLNHDELTSLSLTGTINPSNGAKPLIENDTPYIAALTIQGTTDIIFHAWNCEAIEEKSKAAKGSQAKKQENLESYVLRNDKGDICLPSEYLRMSIVNAARSKQDPRSPRKSALELVKASVIILESLLPLITVGGNTTHGWDFIHKCRAVIQRNAITRCRPAFHKGWCIDAELLVNAPEYITPDFLYDLVSRAGRFVGVADQRPSYGRFQIIKWDVRLD